MTRAATILPTLLAFGLLFLAGPAAAGAHRGGFGRHHGPPLGAMLDFHADELGLEPDTREAVRAIVEASREQGEELRREMKEERQALHELMEQDEVDRDAVLAQVERLGELKTDAEKHRIETMLAIRAQLSPEQRGALAEVRERMHGRHGEIREACSAEAEERCEGDGPRSIHCLLRPRDELSEACSEALSELSERFGRYGRRHHGPPPSWGSPTPYEPGE